MACLQSRQFQIHSAASNKNEGLRLPAPCVRAVLVWLVHVAYSTVYHKRRIQIYNQFIIKITSGTCACPLVHALGNIIPRNHIAIWMELGSEWRVCQVDSFRSTVKRLTTRTKACVYPQHLCSSFLCLVT